MNWLTRLIPTRASLIGAMAAFFAALLAWARRDARQDVEQIAKQKDTEHAKEISDRVRSDRADPERVQPYSDHGYRD